MIRADSLQRLIRDEQAGREDNAKQIWQLLDARAVVRQRAVHGRGGIIGEDLACGRPGVSVAGGMPS